MLRNPFTPTFGAIPPYMAGREEIIDELTRALENGPGSPELTTIISGARGTGKTALLSYMAEKAEGCGWVSANVSALPGMLEEIIQQAQNAASHLLNDPKKQIHLSGLRLGDIAEISFDETEKPTATWRIRMGNLLDDLAKTNTGLLITVDEVRPDLDEMVQLASAFQHFVRERRNIALFMAGLPMHVSTLLQDKSVSFLRRANYYDIGSVSNFEVEQALRKTIEEAGRTIAPNALQEAVQLTEGFPYMIQLIGYRSWNASPENMQMSTNDVEHGAQFARNDMQRKIFDTTLRELSKGDVRFLTAMLDDEGPSDLADIAQRMGKKSNYASQYKRRLIEQGLLIDCGQGSLRIGLPLFKDYLRERLA